MTMNEQVHVPRWVMVVFVGPLVLACLLAAGSTLVYIPQLKSSVDNLKVMQGKLASKEWVKGRNDLYTYQINQLEEAIETNSGRIINNRNLIENLQKKTRSNLNYVPTTSGITDIITASTFLKEY